jgi:hypothetical protein
LRRIPAGLSSFPLVVLGTVFLVLGLVGFVVTDGATCRGANLTMPGHVAGYSANDGTFDAPLGLRGGRQCDREYGAQDGKLHGFLLLFSKSNRGR